MTARLTKARLAKVLEAFAEAGQPVRKVRLPDGTEILVGNDIEEAEADEAKDLETLMRSGMGQKRKRKARAP